MRRFSSRFAELIRYGVVGMGNTLLNFGTFALLAPRMHGTGGLVLANIAAFAVALLHSYYGNSRWTFHRQGSLVRFLAVSMVGLSIDSLVLAALTSHGVPAAAAKIISGAACALWNYLASSTLVFRKRADQPEEQPAPVFHLVPLTADGLHTLEQQMESALTRVRDDLAQKWQSNAENSRGDMK